MEPKFKVLERISEEARRKVAERVFDRERWQRGKGTFYVCKQGDCIWAALLKEAGILLSVHAPHDTTVARKLGILGSPEAYEITRIMTINDDGKLDTPEAVRELLGVPPATGANGGER